MTMFPVIVASGDVTTRDEIELMIEKIDESMERGYELRHFGTQYLDQIAERINGARRNGESIQGILIVDENARRNAETPGEPNLEHTLTCIEETRANHPGLHFVLLAQTFDTWIYDRLQNVDARYVRSDEVDYLEKLEETLQTLIGKLKTGGAGAPGRGTTAPVPGASDLFARIDLSFLNEEEPPTFAVKYYYDGEEIPVVEEPLCRPDLLKRFIRNSTEIDESVEKNWQELPDRLNRIGTDGSMLFTEGNFRKKYRKALSLAEDDNNRKVMVKIKTSPEQFGGLYEAIKPTCDDKPFVIKHPTIRTVSFDLPKPSLKWTSLDRINILVVLADTGPRRERILHYGAEQELPGVALGPLPYVAEEGKIFERLKQAVTGDQPFSPFRSGKAAKPLCVGIGKITILTLGDTGDSFKDAIERELTEPTEAAEQYDIFHFAGHTFDPDSGGPNSNCQFILPSPNPDKLVGVNLATLSGWLEDSNVQFVYLSCCSSVPPSGGSTGANTPAAVAQILAQDCIPVTLGFRWNIVDKSAAKFAKIFYQNLFCNTIYFEDATQKSRDKIYRDSATQDIMWAAPVLLYQAS